MDECVNAIERAECYKNSSRINVNLELVDRLSEQSHQHVVDVRLNQTRPPCPSYIGLPLHGQ